MTTRQIKKYFAEATTEAQVMNMWKQYAEAWWVAGSKLPRNAYDGICEAHWDALYRLGHKFTKLEVLAIESHKKYTAPWNR